MQEEMGVLEVAFSNFRSLGLVGGVLYKEEKLVAFTIGERLNSNTFVVHFEKAFPDLQGAYPMINQQFILHEGQDYTYVNREEDTGDLGLRKAKLSYYPDILLKKYMAMESDVVFGNEFDREDIIDIWQQCFGDERDYIEMYMDNRFETENMLVIHEDGRPVSMASFLPVNIMIDGEYVSAKYVYAVATLPDYRKKGYASKILKYASKKYNEPLILQPENDKLVEYYERLGFVEAFKESPCWIYEICESKSYEVDLGKSISASKYKEIRDKYFENNGYIQWDEAAIDYAIKENEFCGGKTILIGDNEALMFRVDECNRLWVIEATLEEEKLLKWLPNLMDTINVKCAYARNKGGMILFPQNLPNDGFNEGYLGLTLG
jgi:hypothetical protein